MPGKILIIGQGLAGTMLAFDLLERGVPFQIVDDGHASAASMVGIACINPVTGRRYAKSWQIDALIPIAADAYARAGHLLGRSYFSPAHILQILPDDRIEEIWMLRASDPAFQSFLDAEILEFRHPGIRDAKAARILNGYHLEVSAFLQDAAKWFAGKGLLIQSSLDPHALVLDEGPLHWGTLTFKHIIFCDGYRSSANPFFDHLELYPMKGEYLILHIPELNLRTHVKTNVSLIPLPEKDLYWCGSTYDRYNDDLSPTLAGKEYLLAQVSKILTAGFTVAHHGTGIRATTRDRRPYVGTHPETRQVHVITGMGTKGASLAPLCAKILADTLLNGTEIPAEVDILRYAQR